MKLAALLLTATAVAAIVPNMNHNFTVERHEKFPDHQLLVTNPSKLQLDTVKQASGYLTVRKPAGSGNHNMFFWFFESRSNPKKDPLVLWLNGGPGCSSLEGMLFENGPAFIDENIEVHHNPYSWNSNASVIFLDQPVGTGFSYGGKDAVQDTPTASHDFSAFLTLFFKQFPQYKALPFHITGESYAGRYIPVFASDIVSDKSLGIHLTSVAIGNGMIDPLTQYGGGYYAKMCTAAKLPQRTCNSMAAAVDRCKSGIQRCYSQPASKYTCTSATSVCESSQLNPYSRLGLNPYDYTKKCEGSDGLCYADLANLQKYLNQAFVKQAIGATEALTFNSCSDNVNRAFNSAGDWMQPFVHRFTTLLDANIPVLIYAGDLDFICNWMGNEASTRAFKWKGQDQYNDQAPLPWKTKRGHVGDVTNYKQLTFLRLFQAGHLVPHDQPQNALDMMNTWMKGDLAFGTGKQRHLGLNESMSDAMSNSTTMGVKLKTASS